MQWRTKRKLTYTSLALLPLLIIAGVIYTATFFPEPTCFDGEQNGTETGVDCGGDCKRVCQADLPAVSVSWDRAFKVSGNIYNLAAYIQNPNTDLIAKDVPYVFRIYDENNILITERRGEITLLPQPTNVAFSGGVDTKGRQPGRVVFEFTEPPFWESTEITNIRFPVTDRDLVTGSSPRLSLDITNSNQRPVSRVQLTALVFDTEDEAVHVSQTVVHNLQVQETTSAIFTWREPFPGEGSAYRTEIVPTAYTLEQ